MIKTTIKLIAFILILFLAVLTVFQKKMIYPGMSRQGQILKEPFKQIYDSYYKKGSTGKIWLFFGGNGAIPADYIDHMDLIDPDHSFLIVTYPGYNGVKKDLNPKTTNETIDNCIKEIIQKGYKYSDINFMCYSLGCAIAINWLSENKIPINNLVLLAPFWSLDEIVYSKYPFPPLIIKLLMDHNWENEKLKHIHKDINITILHGKQDKLIHYNHSERLSELRKTKLILTEDDDHQSIRNKIPDLFNNIFKN
jgi:predicted esterase